MNYRTAPNVRYVDIQYGDDLRKISLRELGTADKWVDLVLLNDLKPPYIAEVASSGVLAYGDRISVPAAAATISAAQDPAAVYGVDAALSKKRLVIEGGDIAVVAGIPNLSQALANRIMVQKRELGFHPQYGCYVHTILGRLNGPSAGQLAALYVKSSLLEDARVATVPSCVATVLGDQISVEATVQPVSGKPVELKVVL